VDVKFTGNLSTKEGHGLRVFENRASEEYLNLKERK
jgi:hypothetical protein